MQILTRKRPCAAEHGDAALQIVATAAAASAVAAALFPVGPVLRVVVEAAQIPWIGGGLMLGAMALALLADPIRRAF